MEKIVIGIVIRNKQVLIVRRKQKEGDLFWQFPGGTVEENEMIYDAVVRELKEETGIESKVIELLGERLHPSTQKYISYIACEYIGGELCVNDDDLDRVEWINISEICNIFTTPVFDKVMNYLNNQL